MFTLTTRKVIMGVLVVLSVILVFYFIYHFRTVVMLVFTGIVISISMAPAVDWLHQHKLPRSFSVILIYLGLLILIIRHYFSSHPPNDPAGNARLHPGLRAFTPTQNLPYKIHPFPSFANGSVIYLPA